MDASCGDFVVLQRKAWPILKSWNMAARTLPRSKQLEKICLEHLRQQNNLKEASKDAEQKAKRQRIAAHKETEEDVNNLIDF